MTPMMKKLTIRSILCSAAALLLLTSALVLLPFVWMLSLSLKPPGEIFRASFALLPQQWYGWQNYTRALTGVPLPRFLLNGVIVCGAILFLQLLSLNLSR